LRGYFKAGVRGKTGGRERKKKGRKETEGMGEKHLYKINV